LDPLERDKKTKEFVYRDHLCIRSFFPFIGGFFGFYERYKLIVTHKSIVGCQS
jgi:deoxyinosine 3'endonuclease (endonuclease V)